MSVFRRCGESTPGTRGVLLQNMREVASCHLGGPGHRRCCFAPLVFDVVLSAVEAQFLLATCDVEFHVETKNFVSDCLIEPQLVVDVSLRRSVYCPSTFDILTVRVPLIALRGV